MRSEIVRVTPKMAGELLNKLNAGNRPLSNATVEKYADAMRSGMWKENNGVPIIIGKKRLLDGQHRLYAIIESGVTIRQIIHWGADDDSFDTIDGHRPRSPGDILHIAGVEKNERTVGAAIAICIAYRRGDMHLMKPIAKYDIRRFAEENPEIIQWVNRAIGTKGWTKSYAAPVAALLYLGSFQLPDKAEQFLEGFGTGENLTQGSPILAIRNRVAAEKRMRKHERFALFVVAWNAFVKGRQVIKLIGPRDSYVPAIVGARTGYGPADKAA